MALLRPPWRGVAWEERVSLIGGKGRGRGRGRRALLPELRMEFSIHYFPLLIGIGLY